MFGDAGSTQGDKMTRYNREMTEEERSKHNERIRMRRGYRRREHNEGMRRRRDNHREEYNEMHRKRVAERREEYNERAREYKAKDLNKRGIKKNNIRKISRRYLLSKHAKLEGYEIHHCFGYEDPKKFIYIPKRLHIRIHQFLRDNNVSADSDHWIAIRDIVKFSDEYSYISC